MIPEELKELFALVEAKDISTKNNEIKFMFPKKYTTVFVEYCEKKLIDKYGYCLFGYKYDDYDIATLLRR